jgi:hypothetical protein
MFNNDLGHKSTKKERGIRFGLMITDKEQDVTEKNFNNGPPLGLY